MIVAEAVKHSDRSLLRVGRVVVRVVLLGLVLSSAIAAPASAAKIAWSGAGPYEACLEEAADGWISKTAELLVINEDGARATSDMEVMGFIIQAMKTCEAKGKPANAANEDIFGKYMARWREHVYEMMKVIRAKGGSD